MQQTEDPLIEQTIKEAYDDWHAQIDSYEVDGSDSPWHQMVKPQLGDLQNRRVLEIGCGRGGFSKYLCEQGAILTSADFSDTAVQITRRNLAAYPNADARVADIQAMPFDDNSFEVVISLETLEHVPNPDQGIAELVRVTQPGGKLIITTPNYFSLLGLHRIYRELTGRKYQEHGQPINNFVLLQQRVRTLHRLGCRMDLISSAGYYFPLPGHRSINLSALAHPRSVAKWWGQHSLTVATRL